MPSLKDLMSSSSRQSLLSTVQVGEIFRIKLTIEEGIIPKGENDVSRNKYFIVIGKTNDKDTFIKFISRYFYGRFI